MTRATLAYLYLALFAACVGFAGWASATLVDGAVGVLVGAAAAGGAFEALRGATGRRMAAAIDAS